MKDDIVMPEFSETLEIELEPSDYEICDLVFCIALDCSKCALYNKENYNAWQKQQKEKSSE